MADPRRLIGDSVAARGAELATMPEPVAMYGDTREPTPPGRIPYTGTLTPLQWRELVRGPHPTGTAFVDDEQRAQAWAEHGDRIRSRLPDGIVAWADEDDE